ncbi:MAG: hypothetical protein BA863_09775 [Desulfovibrio sp. S3730MH75]|nr:MAG: hypothetical protein BA863_09775 [Desulfovibrio sp. S3730MH75]
MGNVNTGELCSDLEGVAAAIVGAVKLLSRVCIAKNAAETFFHAVFELAFIYAAGLAAKYTELPIMRSSLMMTSKKKCLTFQ